jgi:hypothetical protein
MSQINETKPSYTIPLMSTLIIHFHLCLFLESDFFLSHFPTVIVIQLLFPVCAICIVHLTLIYYLVKKIELTRLSVLVINYSTVQSPS